MSQPKEKEKSRRFGCCRITSYNVCYTKLLRTFGKLADGFGLDMRLSAGELLGLTKVIAAPKITTLDKREAKISQGESIPFQTTSLQGTQTTFVDANLELNVTPQITSRDPNEEYKRILMKVRATP